MSRWSTSRLVPPLLVLGLLVLVITACDRQDNHWDAFDPDLKLLSVETDTLRLIEGVEEARFRLALQMVPDDTVWIFITADDSQVVADPDTVLFVPVDDEWTYPQFVTVTAVDDLVAEGPHMDALTVQVVSNDAAYNAQGGPSLIPVLIVDDDLAGVHVTETSLTLVESTAGLVSETYRIRLLSQPEFEVTITATETTAEPSLHLDPAVLTFTPDNWGVEQEIRLWAELDNIDADNMDLVVTHVAVSADPDYDANLTVASVAIALRDDTLPPVASLALVTPGLTTMVESAGATSLDVVVALDRFSEVPVTVHLFTRNGTATGGADFQALDLELVFAPGGALSQVISVVALDDATTEAPENFQVLISAVANVMVGEENRLDLIIVDDDQVTVSMVGQSVNEDDGSAVFIVSVPSPLELAVGFTLMTSNGTAEAGSDYDGIVAHFTIEPGQTQRIVPVVIRTDQAHETDETLTASLSGLSSNGVWDGVPALITIVNDDPQAIIFADIEVDEGSPHARFIIELAAPFNEDVILSVNTLSGDGAGSVSGDEDALGGQDFDTVVAGAWTIPAGATDGFFQVALIRESAGEAEREYFRLNIQAASRPEFVGLEAVCAILDEDQPQLAVGDASVLESDANATFTVTVLNQAGNPVVSLADISFDYTTVDQTAIGEADYTTTTGSVIVPAGTATVDIVVPILEDAHDDDNETFVLYLTAPMNATILDDGSAPFCTITDNEFPSINLSQTIVAENEGSVHSFTVFLTTPRQDPTSFILDLDPGSSGGLGVDYNSSSAGYRIIPAFTSALNFEVSYLDDQLAGEVDEIIQARLSNADVALGVTTLDMTIVDAPALNIQPDAVTEGTDLIFDVSLTALSTADVTFSAQFSSGAANVLVDIDGSNTGPFTIPAGSTTMSIATPTIAGDGGDWAVEDFVITMINPVNATLGAFNSAIGLITDGDPPILDLAGSATAVEGTDIAFVINLSWASGADIEFSVAFADGTAAGANIDFNDFSTGPFTVPAGTLSATVLVPTMDLDGPELFLEDFVISLNSPVNALLGTTTIVSGFIEDGDQPVLTIPAGDMVVEGGILNFTINLNPPTIVPVFFDLVFSDGSTQGVADFVPSSTGPFSMMPGTTDTTITVATIDDATFENVEQFVVRLAADPTNAVVGVPDQANGVINDND